MKVLVYRYNSICEPDIIETYREMGLTVVEFTREMTDKSCSVKELLREVGEFIQENPVDFVFSINFYPHLAEVCNIFHIRYVSWIVDSPIMELYSKAITREYNRVFLFDRALYNEISPFNPGRIFHLPLAANIDSKQDLFRQTSSQTKQRFSHEVSFVGSLYTEKCLYDSVSGLPENTKGYLDGIISAQKNIYGYYFIEELLSDELVEIFKNCFEDFYSLPEGNFLTDKRTLAQLYIGNKISAIERVETFGSISEKFDVSIYTASDTSGIPKLHNMGTAKTLTEMPIIFNQSKINLNITSKIIRTGLPLRIFDILSCEGFLISNYQEEIPELFVPGEDLVMYSSLDELNFLIEYYLNHDEERREIARSGFERLRNNYTYEKQMEKMLLTAFEN